MILNNLIFYDDSAFPRRGVLGRYSFGALKFTFKMAELRFIDLRYHGWYIIRISFFSSCYRLRQINFISLGYPGIIGSVPNSDLVSCANAVSSIPNSQCATAKKDNRIEFTTGSSSQDDQDAADDEVIPHDPHAFLLHGSK